jgi:hypothetical protein
MLTTIWEFLDSIKGEILTGIGTVVILCGGSIIALLRHRKRLFLGRITFGANKVKEEDGREFLYLDTWGEFPLREVLLDSDILPDRMVKATRRCTERDVLIKLQPSDQELMKTAVLNQLSEMTRAGSVINLVDGRTRKIEVFCVVCYEPYGEMKARKFRVMIARAEFLEKCLDPEFRESLSFRRAHHRDRLTTLKIMAEMWDHERKLSFDNRTFTFSVRIEVPEIYFIDFVHIEKLVTAIAKKLGVTA